MSQDTYTRGKRPSEVRAAAVAMLHQQFDPDNPDHVSAVLDRFCAECKATGVRVMPPPPKSAVGPHIVNFALTGVDGRNGSRFGVSSAISDMTVAAMAEELIGYFDDMRP